jgi:hypothetical protein
VRSEKKNPITPDLEPIMSIETEVEPIIRVCETCGWPDVQIPGEMLSERCRNPKCLTPLPATPSASDEGPIEDLVDALPPTRHSNP